MDEPWELKGVSEEPRKPVARQPVEQQRVAHLTYSPTARVAS